MTMSGRELKPTSSFAVLRALWKAARLRSVGRRRHQQKLFSNKNRTNTGRWAVLGKIFAVLLGVIVHTVFAIMVTRLADDKLGIPVRVGDKVILAEKYIKELNEVAEDEKDFARKWRESIKSYGEIEELIEQLHKVNPEKSELRATISEHRASLRDREASVKELKEASLRVAGLSLAYRQGEKIYDGSDSEDKYVELVTMQFEKYGGAGFMAEEEIHARFAKPQTWNDELVALCSLLMLLWIIMMVCSGEGLELDVQRRRHPHWEWLLSHPIRPAAAFTGEMLGPMMGNPLYLTAPLFWIIVLSSFYPFWAALLGGTLLGLAFALVTSAMNKAIEIGVMLRLPLRSRGAALAVMSWFGFVTMWSPFFLGKLVDATSSARMLVPIAGRVSRWSLHALTAGWSQAEPHFGQALASGFGLAAVIGIAALAVVSFAGARGLEVRGGLTKSAVQTSRTFSGRGKSTLYRKELLWLGRDRGAIVQAVLIPISLVLLQVVNFANLSTTIPMSWHFAAGLTCLAGVYFLLNLGPRSLASEGDALWIALTWPRGLEELLKTKALLWWFITNGLVFATLAVIVFFFPAHWWKIVLLGATWAVFAHSLSLNSVALVRAPEGTGDPQPVSRGRQIAAWLGCLAFCSGVISQAWHVAFMGLVFTALVSAALWQDLRSRLPYLFDPWSEESPQAPTLLHAIIAIVVVVEVVGIVASVCYGVGGDTALAWGRTISYGVVALFAFWIVQGFLRDMDISLSDITRWPDVAGRARWLDISQAGWNARTILVTAGLGVAGGLLGALAHGYLWFLWHCPLTEPLVRSAAQVPMTNVAGAVLFFILTVLMAPLAEEYLFRGLLLRALSREWSVPMSILGSAAFFAIYHPPIAWLPVGFMGLLAAFAFRKTGRLAPCVAIHMAYNAVVVLWS